MGNSSSRYGDPGYPSTRYRDPAGWPTRGPSKRSRSFAGPGSYYTDDRYDYEYPQTRPMPPPPPPQMQGFIPQPAYSYVQPVTAPNLPYPPVNVPPGVAPVIPPAPQFVPAPSMGMPVPPVPTVYPPTNAGYAAPPPPPPQMQMPQPDTSYAEMPPPPRRAGTPFIPPLGPGQYGPNDDRSSSSSSDDQSLDYRPRPPPQHHVRARSYDLHERQRRNPLPTPPKDVFASSPYVHLLRDLQKPVDEVLAERQQNVPPRAVMIAPVQAPLMSQQMPRSRSVKKKKGGLFSRLTGRHHHDRELDAIAEQPQPIVNILTQQPITIPAPQGRPMPGGGTEYVYMPPMAQPPPPNQPPPQVPDAQTPSTAPLRMPTPTPSHRMASPSPHHMASPSPHHMPSPAPQRMPSPTPSHRSHRSRAASPSPRSPDGRPPPIKIHMENGFSGLIHYSPHNVYYERKVFPTAYHLLEARKFMDHQPDIVERIRACGSGMDGIEQARRVAEDMARFVRPDWDQVVIPIMEEITYHKMGQHPDLQQILLGTGNAELVYSDPHDDFWGDGPVGQGRNELGKALMRVRERLLADGN